MAKKTDVEVKKDNRFQYDLPDKEYEGDAHDPIVVKFLNVISQAENYRAEKRTEVDNIQRMIKNAYKATADKNDPVLIYSKIGLNTIKKAEQRMTYPNYDFELYGYKSGELKPPKNLVESAIKACVEHVLRRGGFIDAVKDGDGAMIDTQLKYGDAFCYIREGSDAPVEFTSIPWENVDVPPEATSIRGASTGRNADKVVVRVVMTYDEYVNFVKNVLKQGGKYEKNALSTPIGMLPRNWDETSKEFRNTTQDTERQKNRLIEVGYCIDMNAKEYIIIAGSHATIIKPNLKDFPFTDQWDNTYLPVGHLYPHKGVDGFYNYGVGHYVYQDDFVDGILKNNIIKGNINETRPIRIMNIPDGRAAQIEGLLAAAREDQAAGIDAIVPNEIPYGAPSSMGKVESLSAGQGTDFSGVIRSIVATDIVNYGISLNEVDIPASQTKGVTEIEQENRNSLIKEITDTNSPRYREMIVIAVEILKKMNKNNPFWDEPFPIDNIKVKDEKDKQFVESLTIGDIVEYLNQAKYEIKMDSSSGIIPNPAVERAKLTDSMNAFAQLSDPEIQKTFGVEYLRKSGYYFDEKNFAQLEQGLEQQI